LTPVPFGILQLAACVRKAGHKVEIISFSGRRIVSKEVLQKIYASVPDLICITLYTTPGLLRSMKFIHIIKKYMPFIKIAVGGPHATIFNKSLFNELPVDFIGIGEGDLSLPQLCNAIHSRKKLSNIKGFFINQDRILFTGEPETLSSLETLPFPAFDLINFHEFTYVYLIESYGCPYRCSFCYTHMHNHFRSKSPQRVFNDILTLYEKYNINFFKFWDDLPFGANREKMIQFCRLVIKNKLNISFSCVVRPHLIDKLTLKYLIRAGCYRVSMGIESGSPRILKLLNKKNKISDYIKAFKILNEFNIITSVSFMLGLPTETEEDIQQTLLLARKLNATEYFPQNYKPYPGTLLYQQAINSGFSPPTSLKEWAEFSDLTKYNCNVSNISNEHLKKCRNLLLSLNKPRKNLKLTVRAILKTYKTNLKSTGTHILTAYTILKNRMQEYK